MRAGKRRRRTATGRQPTTALADVLKRRLTNADPRSHAEFLADTRARQSAGQLTNPTTAALIDRLSIALSRHTQ